MNPSIMLNERNQRHKCILHGFGFSEVLEKAKLGGGDGNQNSALLGEWGHSLAGHQGGF